MTITAERLAKLPGWARDHIAALQRQRDLKQQIIEEMRGENADSPWEILSIDWTTKSLVGSRHSTIRLWLTDKHYVDLHLREVHTPQGVFPVLSVHTDGYLNFTPSASNAGYLYPSRHLGGQG